ncbi:MAG: hypothetical protein FWF94_05505 [Oscillospiraceae bacterium]|nr:hypothetical protein [Oscillospiraceae bacterium]
MFELRVNNQSCSFEPQVCDGVLYESFNQGRCSKLSFGIIGQKLLGNQFAIRAGDKVGLKVNGRKMFFGVVFQRKKEHNGIETVTAYDQLRYLKNKDTYIYSGKRASDVIRTIALDYKLRVGDIDQTQCIIPERIEDDVALSDIIENALDYEYERSGTRFTLIDEFGELSLKNEAQMFSGAELNRDTIGELSFFSSIEGRSNRIKLSRQENNSSDREVYIARDIDSEYRIGVLQHYMKISDENEALVSRANSLLAIYNKDERSVSVKNALGDVRVRGGSGIALNFDEFKGNATVLQCVHKLNGEQHLMDLVLGGI